MSRDPRDDDSSTRDAERDAAGERAPGDDPADRRAIAERDRRSPSARAGNWAATAALICGVVGLVALFVAPPLGLLLALAAVVLGIVGIVRARAPDVGGTAQAVIGLVTGAIALLLTALVIWGITALVQNPDFQQELRDQIEEVQNQTGD